MRQAELLRYLLLAAQREGNRQLSSDLRPIGLTPAQAEVMRILGDNEPMTLTGLGELLVCESGTNPSRLVDRLVGAGFVERVAAAGDRRQVVLSLTIAGRHAEAEVRVVEERLYVNLDAASDGVGMQSVIEVLRRFSAGQPSGAALEKRIAAEGVAHPPTARGIGASR